MEDYKNTDENIFCWDVPAMGKDVLRFRYDNESILENNLVDNSFIITEDNLICYYERVVFKCCLCNHQEEHYVLHKRPYVFTFGEYKGKTLYEVPTSYLISLSAGNIDSKEMGEHIHDLVQKEILCRREFIKQRQNLFSNMVKEKIDPELKQLKEELERKLGKPINRRNK